MIPLRLLNDLDHLAGADGTATFADSELLAFVLYQYDLKWEEWEQHKNQIRELLWYANDLIGLTIDPNTWLTRDNIISMLSCVPADQRKILHQNVMNAVKTHTTKELLDKFRRSWTAEKQTEIDEISVANSIEDIKHILSDPKYSHISRVPNNKWWIEISAIIDEVVAWRLAITYIPSEIRQYVQKFIKQWKENSYLITNP